MQRSLTFRDTKFDSEFIEMAISTFLALSGINDLKQSSYSFDIWNENETVSHDSLEEFLADYQKDFDTVIIRIREGEYLLKVWLLSNRSESLFEVVVKAPTNKEIYKILNLFTQNAHRFEIKSTKPRFEQEEVKEVRIINPVIFIGHGRDKQWRELKDFLQDKLHFKVLAYETGARTGQSIKDILESMLDESDFAVLVLTGEDENLDGKLYARQNVVHETGLFQGRLGFDHAVILLEDGTEEFSNIHGIQHIKFPKNNIESSFGAIAAVIKREF